MEDGPEGAASPSRAPLRPETILWLAGLALLLVFLALEPYLSFSVFGSDTGEYYRLTSDLVSSGTLPYGAAYSGWGSAYPDFPGIFVLAGGAAGALHLDPLSALTIVVPVVAVLSVFPLFLLFRRIYPHDTIALLGAALASVAMPRLFSIAHPAPLALGDFLCVGALWMLLESRRDVRWYLPLSLTAGALIPTHHLSSYFFAIGALGGILLLELWRPGLWSRRYPSRELGFLAAFVSATFVFWFYGTHTFVSKVLLPGFGGSAYVGFGAFEVAALAAIAACAVLIRWRRAPARAGCRWVRLPTDGSVVRDASLIAVGVFGAISLLLVVPLPGTTQQTTPAAILWYAPVLALGILCGGSRRVLTTARLGPFALTWLAALAVSAAATLGFASLGSAYPQYSTATGFASALSPSRHAEYLLIPVGLLVAVGLGRLIARLGDRAGRRAVVAGAVAAILLVAGNAAIVYPPASDLGGFQEGLTHGDATLWMWVGIAEPSTATVATDHRLSSMIFGVDGNPATWVTTPVLFDANANGLAPLATQELISSGVPNPADARPIDLVVVDSVMYSGVALSPSDLAQPLGSAAIAWFAELPFLPVYENGQDVVYLVLLDVGGVFYPVE
ncbi:MAG TPA: hypothetical protein VML94_08765 [Thermoplasmata archaeon]|nr:hypothetical protein [Thermoplasmata archaeon]